MLQQAGKRYAQIGIFGAVKGVDVLPARAVYIKPAVA